MERECRFGIEGMSVHVPRHCIDLGTLAAARGIDPAKYYEGLGGRRMAVVSPDEDPVTMAAEAARRLVERHDVDRSEIGMVVVGSETGVDAAKPIASYVHGLIGLSPQCRTFDTQHACYGATAALQLAAGWCIQGNGSRRKAIVIATDIARYEVGSAGEPTQGAGAIAMLVSCEPRVVAFDRHDEAVFTQDVMDFWRPHYRSTAMVDGRHSLDCYLRALEHTWDAYLGSSGLRFEDFRHLLFHVPFPKMAHKAFHRLHELEAARRGVAMPPAEAMFDTLTRPSLWANVEVGNIYSGSLYLALAGLLEQGDAAIEGARLGLFSYGSGCCAEFYSVLVGPDATAWRGRIGVAEALAGRVEVDYPTYVEMRTRSEGMAGDGSFREPVHPGNGRVRFLGVRDHRRVYQAHISPGGDQLRSCTSRACAGAGSG